jgi:hypothetical protein
LDFGDYDIIFAYLSPAAMSSLYLKAIHEMRNATVLIAQEFPIPGVTATSIISAPVTECPTYVYVITQQVKESCAD